MYLQEFAASHPIHSLDQCPNMMIPNRVLEITEGELNVQKGRSKLTRCGKLKLWSQKHCARVKTSNGGLCGGSVNRKPGASECN